MLLVDFCLWPASVGRSVQFDLVDFLARTRSIHKIRQENLVIYL